MSEDHPIPPPPEMLAAARREQDARDHRARTGRFSHYLSRALADWLLEEAKIGGPGLDFVDRTEIDVQDAGAVAGLVFRSGARLVVTVPITGVTLPPLERLPVTADSLRGINPSGNPAVVPAVPDPWRAQRAPHLGVPRNPANGGHHPGAAPIPRFHGPSGAGNSPPVSNEAPPDSPDGTPPAE